MKKRGRPRIAPNADILRAIRERPGMSTTEIAKHTGMARSVAARWLTDLMLDGRLRKEVRRTVRKDGPPIRTVHYFERDIAASAIVTVTDVPARTPDHTDTWTPPPFIHPIRRAFLNNSWSNVA